MKCFVICFGDIESNFMQGLVSRFSEVRVESQDGGKAYSGISKMQADLVIVDGDKKVSHVLQTLKAVLKAKKFSNLRIIITTMKNEQRIQNLSQDSRVKVTDPKNLDEMLINVTREKGIVLS